MTRTVAFGVFGQALVAASLLSHADQTAAQSTTGVIIRQRVNTAYTQDLTGLTTQLETSNERTVVVKKGETLSQIISREYAVGRSNARAAYEMIEREIVGRNSLPDSNSVTAHRAIRIPDALRNALTSPNPKNRFNVIPKVAIDSRISAPSNLPLSDLAKEPPKKPNVDSSYRDGADEVVRYDLVDEKEAKRRHDLDPSITVESIPVPIKFAQTGNSQPADWMAEPTKQFIRAKLAAPAKQRPILLILDDAWPDDPNFVHSRDFFEASLAEIRKAKKLPPESFSSAIRAASAIKWSVAQPAQTHAAQIRDALAPLQQLAPNQGPVEIVYLPLFARDKGAAEVLTAIIVLNKVLLDTREPIYDPIKPEILKPYQTMAGTIVSSLSHSNQTATALESDVAVIEAAMNFCSHFSQTTTRPCFLSMSWTTPDKWYQPNVPAGFYGLFVAAAGNERPSTNIYTDKRQFAARSMSPGDVLAVMNIDDNGNPTCDSSVFGTNLTGVFGVAYPGYLSPTDCGTSFSAPRVAWLLAAREALKSPPADSSVWQKALELEVLNHRQAGAGYNQVRFVPEDVFSR